MSKAAPIIAVEYEHLIKRVRTLEDHTVDVVLNLPEYCVEQAAWFLTRQGSLAKSVTQILTKPDDEQTNKTAKKAKRGTPSMDSRRIRDRRDQSTGG